MVCRRGCTRFYPIYLDPPFRSCFTKMDSPKSKVHGHIKKIWYAPNKFESYGDEEIKAVETCLRKGWLAPGPITEQFEREIASVFEKNSLLWLIQAHQAIYWRCSLQV